MGKTSRFAAGKSAKGCSNHFQYGKLTDSYAHPTSLLKGYNDDVSSKPTRRRLSRPHKQINTVGVSKNFENFKVSQAIEERAVDKMSTMS